MSRKLARQVAKAQAAKEITLETATPADLPMLKVMVYDRSKLFNRIKLDIDALNARIEQLEGRPTPAAQPAAEPVKRLTMPPAAKATAE